MVCYMICYTDRQMVADAISKEGFVMKVLGFVAVVILGIVMLHGIGSIWVACTPGLDDGILTYGRSSSLMGFCR